MPLMASRPRDGGRNEYRNAGAGERRPFPRRSWPSAHFETQIAGESDAAARPARTGDRGVCPLGLPHRRVEEWKYTDLRAKMREAYAPAPRAEVSEAEIERAIGHFAGLDAHVVVFVNGHHQPMPAVDAPHVQIMSLTQAFDVAPEWFDKLRPGEPAGRRDGRQPGHGVHERWRGDPHHAPRPTGQRPSRSTLSSSPPARSRAAWRRAT